MSKDLIADMSLDWNELVLINEKSREVIAETLSEASRSGLILKYVRKDFDDFINQNDIKCIQDWSKPETLIQTKGVNS